MPETSCPLCTNINETFRVVKETPFSYALVPLRPLGEAHLLLVPKKHGKVESLTAKELKDLHQLATELKDKLVQLFPQGYPLFFSAMDSKNASILDHAHWHLLSFVDNWRKIVHVYDTKIPENQEASREELERRAEIWKEGSRCFQGL